MSDKHGFRFYQPISPGAAFHHAQTLCLEKPIPHQGFEVIPGIIIMSCTCFKLGFCPSTVQVVASYLISMVFEIRHPKSPGINTPIRAKPCLSTLLPPIAVADHPSSKPSKHGVYSGNMSAPRGSGWRFPNTMLRTYAAHSCINAHPPALLLSLGSGFGALPCPGQCCRIVGLPEPKFKGGVPEVIASKSLRGVEHRA